MDVSRKRRIVRRAAIALAIVVLTGLAVAWFALREPPEIQRSRALRLGMTPAEVEAIMGKADATWTEVLPLEITVGGAGIPASNIRPGGLLFGRSIANKIRMRDWLGLNQRSFGLTGDLQSNEWPVRVRLDENGRVDLIRRSLEVERSYD